MSLTASIIVCIICCLIICAIVVYVAGIRQVPDNTVYMVERFGKFHRKLKPGIHVIFILSDRIAKKIKNEEVALELPEVSVLSKNKWSAKVKTNMLCAISDYEKFAYNVGPEMKKVEEVALAVISKTLGDQELEKWLGTRSRVGTTIATRIDQEISAMGLKILKFSIWNIELDEMARKMVNAAEITRINKEIELSEPRKKQKRNVVIARPILNKYAREK